MFFSGELTDASLLRNSCLAYFMKGLFSTNFPGQHVVSLAECLKMYVHLIFTGSNYPRK